MIPLLRCPANPAHQTRVLCHTKAVAKKAGNAPAATILRLYKKNVNYHTVPQKLWPQTNRLG